MKFPYVLLNKKHNLLFDNMTVVFLPFANFIDFSSIIVSINKRSLGHYIALGYKNKDRTCIHVSKAQIRKYKSVSG